MAGQGPRTLTIGIALQDVCPLFTIVSVHVSMIVCEPVVTVCVKIGTGFGGRVLIGVLLPTLSQWGRTTAIDRCSSRAAIQDRWIRSYVSKGMNISTARWRGIQSLRDFCTNLQACRCSCCVRANIKDAFALMKSSIFLSYYTDMRLYSRADLRRRCGIAVPLAEM